MAVNFLRKIGAKVSNHVLAFARQTAIHGPKYCINRGTIKGSADVETGKSRKIKISRFDRLLWCIAFLFVCYYGYLLYSPFLDTWNYEPTVIDIDQADFPVEKIPFPAVTICSNNKIVYRQLESVLWSKQPWKGLLAYNYNITQETDEGQWIPILGKLYHFSQERITFAKAKATCEHNLGKIFEPKTESINNLIGVIARDNHGIINPWIGIHHIHNEDRAIFASDNTTVTWSYWDANEPNNENDFEDCTHLYNGRPTLEVEGTSWTCNFIETDYNDFWGINGVYSMAGYCQDEFNTEECNWDGGDCCGDNVKTLDNNGFHKTCTACECLEPSRWNDNTCEEFRKFICEKEVTDSITSFDYNYEPANFEKDFISALTSLVTAQDDPQRLKEVTEGTKSILNDYQKELPEVLKQVMQSCDDDGFGMFLGCFWYGKKHSCSSLFQPRPTDSGFCCSFNTLAMEEQFKNGAEWKSGIRNVYYDPCQDWIDPINLKLTSPNYPAIYDPNIICKWNLTTEKGKFISLDFDNIALYPWNNGDYITIYDIDDQGNSMLIAHLTGPDLGPQSIFQSLSNWQKKIISSSSNNMLVEFRSDIEDLYYGFLVGEFGFSASIHYHPVESKLCEKGLNITLKTIQSPNYPHLYDSNLLCRWLIYVPHGSHITLKFTQFELEDGNDTLVIHNGGNEDSKIVQKLTGQMNETKISIPGNQMFVVFKTNKDTVRKGFNAMIVENDHCQYWLNEVDGILTSPNFAYNYDHDLNCKWILNTVQGFYITLQIDYFYVSNGDFISIFDGPDLQSPLISKLDINSKKYESTISSTGNGELRTISTKGSSMLVQFVTDHEGTWYGFSAKFHYTPINQICKDWLNITSGFLKSPDYPTIDCNWVITASLGSTISIQFQALEIESAFLSIYDGGSEKDSQLSVLTGNTLPPTISSTGNQFFITFASNGNGNVAGKGFSASIEFDDICEKVLDLTNKMMVIDNDLLGGTYCQWQISAPDDDNYVTLEFVSLNIDHPLNRILVYDGPDDKSVLIGEIFGTLTHNHVKAISTSGKYMFIDFKREVELNIIEFTSSIKYNKFNSDCQSWIDDNVFISPINPNINCSWIITRKFGSYITLKFKFIELLSEFDYLKIYDGGSKHSDLIKSLTGSYNDLTVSIPRNQMFIAFETSSTVAKRGFNAAILENDDSCQYWLNIENQTLSSPYYPHDYFNDGSSCDWNIIAPEGNKILLEFEHFNLYDDDDYFVTIFDGLCDKMKELQKLSGVVSNQRIIFSSKNYMFVRLAVGTHISTTGFFAKIHYVNCDTVSNGEIGFCNCNTCSENEGDCHSHSECQDGLLCGSNNCPASLGFKIDVNCCNQHGCENPNFIGDEFCDDGNNNEHCLWDGGDCCGSNINTDWCSACECLDPNADPADDSSTSVGISTTINTDYCPDTCGSPSYKDDQYCDDENNNCGCEWDGGACCGSDVDTTWCSACQCLDPNADPADDSSTTVGISTTINTDYCEYPNYIGDYSCDDGNNNEHCQWDGGDCCGSDVGTDWCSACECLDPNADPTDDSSTNSAPTSTTINTDDCEYPHFIGDDSCDDGNNFEYCQWDGGDCCGSDINTDWCSACECLDPNGDNSRRYGSKELIESDYRMMKKIRENVSKHLKHSGRDRKNDMLLTIPPTHYYHLDMPQFRNMHIKRSKIVRNINQDKAKTSKTNAYELASNCGGKGTTYEGSTIVCHHLASSAESLIVILNPNEAEYKTDAVKNNFIGFKTLVHSPYDFPFVEAVGKAMGPNIRSYIAFLGLHTWITEDANAYKPEQKNCASKDDLELDVFHDYTRKNCLFECQAKSIFKKCGCLPYNYPEFHVAVTGIWKDVNSTACNYTQLICLSEVPRRSNCTYQCPSDCVVTKYDITHSGTPRSEDDSLLHITSLSKKNELLYNLDREIKSLDHICILPEVKERMVKELEQLKESIAYSSSHVHFFWQHETMVSHVKDQVYDLWDMIAGFGGCYGVAIGFSITAAMEILYWMFIKPFGLPFEKKCKCTQHHYPTPTSKRITTCVEGTAVASFLIFTGFRIYLVFDRLLFNPPLPEEPRNKIYLDY